MADKINIYDGKEYTLDEIISLCEEAKKDGNDDFFKDVASNSIIIHALIKKVKEQESTIESMKKEFLDW